MINTAEMSSLCLVFYFQVCTGGRQGAERQELWTSDRQTGRSDWPRGFLPQGIGWLSCWLADWLIGWLTDWWVDWLGDCLTDWVIDWSLGWLTGWLIGWLVDWQVKNDVVLEMLKKKQVGKVWTSISDSHWLVDWLIYELIDWLVLID